MDRRRRFLILLLFLLGSALGQLGKPSSCPQGTMTSYHRNKCFRVVPIAVSFEHAEITCHNFQSRLATVYNKYDNQIINNAASLITQNMFLKTKEFWLGGRDDIADNEGTWEWINAEENSRMNYTNWAKNEPSKNGLNCLQIHAHSGKWKAGNCYKPYPYVCESDLAMNTTKAPTTCPRKLKTTSEIQ
ncbi:hypothetical protein L596_029687 [Steinernema carpocapsae]|uniref:C-type lectin domain-containing protein n=1 Tax=Steinernema carpocapsae TaxID=34508 RepID=A0A4U5LQF6_STECR|nr:hypothetical protein L596_029687 [Steinernema carpocapsae]